MTNPETIRILLVEDDPGDAGLVREALAKARGARFGVRVAGTLAAARAELRHGADLVLLDLHLPDSDGVATVERLRADCGRTPVVVITGRGDPDFALEAIAAGAADYVCKGEFGSDSLSRIIRHNLARAALDAELDRHRRELEMRVAERTAELQAAKDAAEQASHAKSLFLGNVGHEIRTPLHGIIGLADVMIRHPATPADHVDRLRRIVDAGHQLGELIERILDLAALESGSLRLAREAFAPVDLVAAIEARYLPLALARGLLLTCEADRLPAQGVGDPARIRQVIEGFLDNALRATRDGTITLTASADGAVDDPTLLFEIRDSGPGIDAELMPKLFRPFVQGDMSLTREHCGPGLGLAINDGLVRLMGGEVGVESVPGQGSVFWCTIRVGGRPR